MLFNLTLMTGIVRIVIGDLQCHDGLRLFYMAVCFVRDREGFESNSYQSRPATVVDQARAMRLKTRPSRL